MHPVAWIVWAAGGGLAAMSTTNPFYLAPLLGGAWLVHSVHARTDSALKGSFRIFLIAGLVTLIIRCVLVLAGPVNEGSLALAFAEGARLAVMLSIFGAFNSVADPFGVLRLAPHRFHEAALATALSLSIAPRMIAAASRVRDAQRARGLNLGGMGAIPALAVPVLETGMEEALTLAESMDARGHGRGRRTRYRPQRWTTAAFLTAAAGAGAGAFFVARGLAGAHDLVLPAFPLTWPDADPVTLAAALLLCVPALLPVRTR